MPAQNDTAVCHTGRISGESCRRNIQLTKQLSDETCTSRGRQLQIPYRTRLYVSQLSDEMMLMRIQDVGAEEQYLFSELVWCLAGSRKKVWVQPGCG